MDPVDLRSDFLSRPTRAMLLAMQRWVGTPQGYGLQDDPTQRRLERRAADLLGKEDALFCPTCMMANQLAVRVQCRPGQSILLDADSHMLNSESGALAAQAGVLTWPIASVAGRIDLDELRGQAASAVLRGSPAALIALENTHNKAGGIALPRAWLEDVHALVPDVPIHLDGSRLFNAAVAQGTHAAELCSAATTVSVSLNKGLCAPNGAILAGPRALIEEAVRQRQVLGGGWRPVGMLAAAALVGLDTMIDRLAQDHEHARQLAEGLAGMAGIRIDLDTVQTNIVRGRLDTTLTAPQAFAQHLAAQGILIGIDATGAFRLVTCHDIRDQDVTRTLEVFTKITNTFDTGSRQP